MEWALQKLDLVEHADKPAGQYSGGNRRRLSAAIALLGAPQLLLLVSGRGSPIDRGYKYSGTSEQGHYGANPCREVVPISEVEIR